MGVRRVRPIYGRPLLVFRRTIHSTAPSRRVYLARSGCAIGYRWWQAVLPKGLPTLANRAEHPEFTGPSIDVMHMAALTRIRGIHVFQPVELHGVPIPVPFGGFFFYRT